MKKVAIYTRSSKDLHNVSCKAQEVEIRTKMLAGEEVYKVYTDEALSSINDVRPGFNEMMAEGTRKNPPFTKIYCLDTSRFGRDQFRTQAHLVTLRKKHGIEVVFTNMPNTGTFMDEAVEKMMTIFDEIHSHQSRIKGVASMKQNVRDGYRAGGRPPYGYMAKNNDMGVERRGEEVSKTTLTINPETAEYAKEILVRRSRGESRGTILRDFQRRGIPSPSGKKNWSVSTVKSMEDNIEVYLGHTFFNRLNARNKEDGKVNGYVGGMKYKPESEWVKSYDTHEAIISSETANKIKQIQERGLRATPSRAKRVYALSGLITCNECGCNYTGDRGIYRCNYKNKPGLECSNNGISQNRIEGALFSFMKHEILNFKDIKAFINRIKKGAQGDTMDTKPLQRRLTQLEAELERMLALYRRGKVDPAIIEKEMDEINTQKADTLAELDKVKQETGGIEVDDAVIRESIDKAEQEVSNSDPKIRKRAVRALFQGLTVFPRNDQGETICELKGVSLPLTRIKVASPTRFELVLPA